jgi:hypothetical protein
MLDGCPSALSTSAEDSPKPSLTSATVARDPDRTEQRVLEGNRSRAEGDKRTGNRGPNKSRGMGFTVEWPEDKAVAGMK